jgi:two-component system chemotaxis response regulator CheY
MKSLIVEDDFTSRLLMQKILSAYGECHVAVNGKEAISAFEQSNVERSPYNLICMDIMMPEMDGLTALREIRTLESGMGIEIGDGVKIIMTTAMKDMRTVINSYNEFCDGYLVKPVDKSKLLEEIRKLGLI